MDSETVRLAVAGAALLVALLVGCSWLLALHRRWVDNPWAETPLGDKIVACALAGGLAALVNVAGRALRGARSGGRWRCSAARSSA